MRARGGRRGAGGTGRPARRRATRRGLRATRGGAREMAWEAAGETGIPPPAPPPTRPAPAGPAPRARPPGEKVLPQGDRLVVLLVARRVDQRQPLLRRESPKGADHLGPGGELGEVAAGELVPAGGVVAEPPAQLGGRRRVLEPLPGARPLLRHPPGPDPVDQDADPVRLLRRLVDPFDSDVPHDADKYIKDAVESLKCPF